MVVGGTRYQNIAETKHMNLVWLGFPLLKYYQSFQMTFLKSKVVHEKPGSKYVGYFSLFLHISLSQLKHIEFNLEKPLSKNLEGNTAMVKQKMHSFCILALTEHHIKRPVQCTMVDLPLFRLMDSMLSLNTTEGPRLTRILGLEKIHYMKFMLVELPRVPY